MALTSAIDGTPLQYSITGSGETLLFISGTGLASSIWHYYQVPYFKDSFQCVTYDLRGTGGSAGEGDYGLATLVSDITAILDGVGATEAHVVGYSLGAALAQEFALLHPARVKSLAMISTWSSTAKSDHIRRWFSARRALAQSGVPRSIFNSFGFLMWDQRLLDEEAGRVPALEEMLGSSSAETSLETLARHFACDLAHDAGDRLKGIVAPAAVVYGANDLITLPSYNQEVARLTRASVCEAIPGAGHLILLEEPQAVNEVVHKFLRSLPNTAAHTKDW